MWKRIWVLIKTRNKEYYRDKAAFGWNFIFPFLIIIGFSFLFNDKNQDLFKVALVNKTKIDVNKDQFEFEKTKYIKFFEAESVKWALDKLSHHKIDFVVDFKSKKYWVSNSSPRGYVVEKIFKSTKAFEDSFIKEEITGYEVPYLEWMFPGILGMNMMFSALFGIGYVVVRYRKNGVLKRLSVTPVKSYEFLIAQIFSRIFLLFATTLIVYLGTTLMFGFTCKGSIWTLILVFFLGGFSMISLGLLIAARSSSEEFAGGILNMISWPMMFLSEVWFSLEGASDWVKVFSKIFPLTHMIDGARRVMNDGATIYDIRYNLIILLIMSIVFMAIGSLMFKWKRD